MSATEPPEVREAVDDGLLTIADLQRAPPATRALARGALALDS